MARIHRHVLWVGLLLLMLVVSACNLTGAPEQEQIATNESLLTASPSGMPTRTPISTSGLPTLIFPTNLPTIVAQVPTTSGGFVPTSVRPPLFPSPTPLPVSIMILAPTFGNIVAGNVQVLGSAIHPQFLQYQLEYGPDPNQSNLWFPVAGAVTSPRINELLGIWNTSAVQDARYQLRLRVFLRDGIVLTTVVGNITVQNRVSTPVPTPTQNIPRPVAAFTQDRTTGDAPLRVQFTNQSIGSITGVTWSFGDGNSSQQVNPIHTFNAPGRYTVTLTVNGPGGSSNVSREIDVTSPSAPVAGFTQDRTSGIAPLTIRFEDRSSGNITNYQWNFSDGTTSSERNPQHTFTVPGTYNVFLNVTGPGGTSSVTRQITVGGLQSPTPSPTATITPSVIPPADTPTQVVVVPTETSIPPTATFTDVPTSIPPTATFTDVPTLIPPTATFTDVPTSIPPTATFTDVPTSIPPTATFTDMPTSIPTDVPTATLIPTNTTEPEPVANFGFAVSPEFPLVVQFGNQSTGNLVAVFWDFGDGATSAEVNPQHTYAQGGTYTVTLTVTDTLGRNAQASQQVTVEQALSANFTAQALEAGAVQFTDQSVGAITAWLWDFGDGATSVEQNPQHIYAQGGTYTVTLTITGGNAQTAQTSQQVTVEQALSANFTAQALDAGAVQFTDQSVGAITAWLWDFGDGATSPEQNPQHTYAQGGTYTVTLTITGGNAQTAQTSQQVTVEQALSADFTAQALDAGAVQFTDQSIGAITAWLWDFGDGATSPEQSPQHTYAQTNTYSVRLVVTDANGRSAETTQSIAVDVPLPEPTQPPFDPVENTPVQPDLNQQALFNRVSGIFNAGASQGLGANAFALAGAWFAQPALLDPFAPSNVSSASNAGDLQSIVDFYNARDFNGSTSFNRNSFAVRGDWTAQALLDPNQADQSVCAGASPLDCEITQSSAAVILIAVGVTDMRSGTDVNAFRDTLQQIVTTASNRGVIPVLFTIAPPLDVDLERALAFNGAIIEVAQANDLPVLNTARLLRGVQNGGISPDGGLTSAPNGAGDLSDNAVANSGANAVNRATLRLLNQLRMTFYPNS